MSPRDDLLIFGGIVSDVAYHGQCASFDTRHRQSVDFQIARWAQNYADMEHRTVHPHWSEKYYEDMRAFDEAVTSGDYDAIVALAVKLEPRLKAFRDAP